MKVCVSSEFLYIKDELEKRGYSVLTEQTNTLCDVIICNLKNGGLSSLNMSNNIRREGTLIIDLGSKTIDEIEYIINNRVYSNLF